MNPIADYLGELSAAASPQPPTADHRRGSGAPARSGRSRSAPPLGPPTRRAPRRRALRPARACREPVQRGAPPPAGDGPTPRRRDASRAPAWGPSAPRPYGRSSPRRRFMPTPMPPRREPTDRCRHRDHAARERRPARDAAAAALRAATARARRRRGLPRASPSRTGRRRRPASNPRRRRTRRATPRRPVHRPPAPRVPVRPSRDVIAASAQRVRSAGPARRRPPRASPAFAPGASRPSSRCSGRSRWRWRSPRACRRPSSSRS